MAKPYPMVWRLRAVRFVGAAQSRHAVAERLGESVSCVIKWLQRFSKTEVWRLIKLAVGVPPLKWSTFWDRIIPFSGGGRNGRQARETRGYHSETSAG